MRTRALLVSASILVFGISLKAQETVNGVEVKVDPEERVLLRPRETNFTRFIEQPDARAEMKRALSEFHDASREARRSFLSLHQNMQRLHWTDRDVVKLGVYSAKNKVNFRIYEAAAQRAMDAYTKFYKIKKKAAEVYAQAFEIEPGVQVQQNGWSREKFVGKDQALFMAALDGGYKGVPIDFIDHLRQVEREMKELPEKELNVNSKTKVLTASGAVDEQLNRMIRAEKEGITLPARHLMRPEANWGKSLSKAITDLNLKRARAGGGGGLAIATGVVAAFASGVASAGETESAVDDTDADFSRQSWSRPTRRTSR
ncbi:MAG: hypothetical protein IPJ84_16035 [Bdellovibrionales bacterium]|nr:hypothetical protein [Bdellovibrionales bacterium]